MEATCTGPGTGSGGGAPESARFGATDGQPELRPLPAGGGVEVLGIDLRQLPRPGIAACLDGLLARHGALLLRDQDLDEPSQARASACFGVVAERGPPGQRSRVSYVSSVAEAGSALSTSLGPMDLHFDGCFFDRPYKATILYCLEADPAAGRTQLVDCARAWDRLDPALAARLAGRSALHVYRRGERTRPRLIDSDAPSAVHPLVIEHPESGLAVLYACRLMTMRITQGAGGKADAEAETEADRETLLETLLAHIERHDGVHEHCWEPGDFLVIDNRRMAHGRTAYEATARRVLRRQVIEGVPVARGREVA